METIDPTWRKSTYSGNGGADCVEVADAANEVLVRDTKNRNGGILAFPASAWQTFMMSVR
jgi:hypothetical protein